MLLKLENLYFRGLAFGSASHQKKFGGSLYLTIESLVISSDNLDHSKFSDPIQGATCPRATNTTLFL